MARSESDSVNLRAQTFTQLSSGRPQARTSSCSRGHIGHELELVTHPVFRTAPMPRCNATLGNCGNIDSRSRPDHMPQNTRGAPSDLGIEDLETGTPWHSASHGRWMILKFYPLQLSKWSIVRGDRCFSSWLALPGLSSRFISRRRLK